MKEENRRLRVKKSEHESRIWKNVITDFEGEKGPGAKKYGQLPEAGKGKDMYSLLESSERTAPLSTPLF